jgi:hypothetical protein
MSMFHIWVKYFYNDFIEKFMCRYNEFAKKFMLK